MAFVTIGKATDVPEGSMKAFDVGGAKIALANVGGSYYAFDDTCTHERCSLTEGELMDNAVVCPCHFAEFDIKTGEVLAPPAYVPLKAYPARVQDGMLQLDI